MPKKFSPELRERAVRMVLERQAAEGGPRSHSIRVIGPQVGVGEETLRMWCNRHGHEIAPAAAGETPEQEIRRLRRELAEARRANEMAHSSGGGPATSSGSRSLPGSNASITAAVDRPVWVD